MHILRPQFAIEDAVALDFVARRGFGLLVAQRGAGPFGAHLPIVLHREPQRAMIRVHVTAGNPLAEPVTELDRGLLVVTGPDAYVSNDWYATADQVSTWLYESVHLAGPLRRLPTTENRDHGDALLDTFESRLAPKPALAARRDGAAEAGRDA